jgi:hypothetical protein
MHTGPFDRQVPTHLSVHNPNSKPVAYKVKVTAPKSYVVKPNSGRIEPGETVNVQGEPWFLLDANDAALQQKLVPRLGVDRGFFLHGLQNDW